MRALPKNPVAVVVSILALALLSSGCGSTGSAALRIDGWELGRSEFNDQLDTLASNETMVRLLQISPYAGDADNSYSTQFTSVVLNLHITNRILIDEVERRGLEVDRVAAEQGLVGEIAGAMAQQQFQAASGNMTSAAQQLLDESGWLKEAMITSGAYSAALQADFSRALVTDQALRDIYDSTKDQLDEACSSHILVASTDDDAADLAKAQDLRGQLEAGADFAKLAQENSDDPGSAPQGGDLGCSPEGVFVPEFDEYVWSGEIGAISEPVKTSFGYHLIKVTRRGIPTFEDARPQLEESLQQQAGQELQAWMAEAMVGASVWIDPRFGEWDPSSGFAIPPSGALVPTTTTTAALGTSTMTSESVPATESAPATP